MITISLCGVVERRRAAGRRPRRAAPGRARRRSRRGRGARTRARTALSSRTMRDQSLPALRMLAVRAHRGRALAGSRAVAPSSPVRGERPRRQRGVEVRDAEAARVHVERDVDARGRAPPRRARCSGGSPRSPLRGHEMRDLQPHLGALAPCGSPPRPLGRAGVAPPRVRRVEAAPSSARRARSAPPRSRPAPARTRGRSSSPTRPASSDSRSSSLHLRAARARRPAGRRGRRVASRSWPFGTRLSTLTAGRAARAARSTRRPSST